MHAQYTYFSKRNSMRICKYEPPTNNNNHNHNHNTSVVHEIVDLKQVNDVK